MVRLMAKVNESGAALDVLWKDLTIRAESLPGWADFRTPELAAIAVVGRCSRGWRAWRPWRSAIWWSGAPERGRDPDSRRRRPASR